MSYGVDFGTQNSLVAKWRNNNVDIVSIEGQGRMTPTYVAFRGDEVLVGDEARYQVTRNAPNTLYSIKRLLALNLRSDEAKEIVQLWPFKALAASATSACFDVEAHGAKRRLGLSEVLEVFFGFLIKHTISSLKQPKAKQVVIGVPSKFTYQDRHVVKSAMHKCGVDAVVINEAVAVAAAYCFKAAAENLQNRRILIYNFGAGFVDVAIALLTEAGCSILAHASCNFPGGDDFVNRLVIQFTQEFSSKHGQPVSSVKASERLRLESERVKHMLSTVRSTRAEVDGLQDGIDLSSPITRERFEQLTAGLLRQSMRPVHEALSAARLQPKDIAEVVLVGGSTRIPKVQEQLQELFGGHDLSKVVNADEGVVVGCAIMAAALSGEAGERLSGFSMHDIATHSLGVEVAGGALQPLIHRGAKLPCQAVALLTNVVDGQRGYTIKVYQGEQPVARDNLLLAQLEVGGVQSLRRGKAALEVTLKLGEHGDVSLRAADMSSRGHSKHISMTYLSYPGPPAEDVPLNPQLAPLFVQHQAVKR